MSLRDTIKNKHDAAEAHPFTVALLGGALPVKAYVDLLANQAQVYQALEARAKRCELLETLPGIERFQAMSEDLLELSAEGGEIFPTTAAHIKRIKMADTDGMLAHMYIMHMGDMYGGQLMKSKVPGLAKRYDFEDRSTLVTKFRELLSNDMAAEANVCFDLILELFTEIANEHNIY